MIYEWVETSGQTTDAQPVGERLEFLTRKHRGLTAFQIVEDAEDTTSALHRFFDWDDAVAAEKFRRSQARSLCSLLRVRKTPTAEPRQTFVSVTGDDGRHFVSRPQILTDAEMRAQVIERARRELKTWKRKYRDYDELAPILAALDDVTEPVALGVAAGA